MAELNPSQRKRLSDDIKHTFGKTTNPEDIRFTLLGIEVFVDDDRTIRFTGPAGHEEVSGDIFFGRGFLPLMLGTIQAKLQALSVKPATSRGATRAKPRFSKRARTVLPAQSQEEESFSFDSVPSPQPGSKPTTQAPSEPVADTSPSSSRAQQESRVRRAIQDGREFVSKPVVSALESKPLSPSASSPRKSLRAIRGGQVFSG